MRGIEIAAVGLIAVMMLGPLALAPAYGPYVEPGTAAKVEEATTPLKEGSTDAGMQSTQPMPEQVQPAPEQTPQ